MHHPIRYIPIKAPACLLALLMLAACSVKGPGPEPGTTPTVGEPAPDFTLQTVDGQARTLSDLADDGPVVLLVLRGYPGYQCPICTRQVGDYLSNADAFAKRDATVVMVYPGPADGLTEHAEDFIAGKGLPSHFVFLIDPDYSFTQQYGLRWDAPDETAYPSTFVIQQGDRVVKHKHISHTYTDRPPAREILDVLHQRDAPR